jgi:hypothetical protein
MKFRQIFYLGHWILTLDRTEFFFCLNYAYKKSNKTKIGIIVDIVYCVLKYEISIMEYFQFDFSMVDKEERIQYVGTPLFGKFLSIMNPNARRSILYNKLKTLETFAPFIKRSYATLTDLRAKNDSAAKVLNNKSGKIVLKSIFGEGGAKIEVIPVQGLDTEAIIQRLAATGNDFIEEFVIQHKDLMRLSPSGVNTLRIITQLTVHDEVQILAAFLRISINSVVDNGHAGNMAAPVNLSTGIVDGPAFFIDMTKPDEYYHPITGVQIPGFRIPYWKEIIQFVKDAALYNKESRSVGWDIAVTDEGPLLIEGNNTWDKVPIQRSLKRGLKSLMEPY